MKTKLVFIVSIIIAIFFVDSSFCENVISFGNLQFSQGNNLTVDVFLTNSDSIAGIQLPIAFPKMKRGFEVDTVSFAGSRCSDFDMLFYEKLNDQNGVFLNIISNTDLQNTDKTLTLGSGLLCRLFFSWPDSLNIQNLDSLSNRGFKILKGKKLHDNRISNRDFRFSIWKPDATEVQGRIEPYILGRVR